MSQTTCASTSTTFLVHLTKVAQPLQNLNGFLQRSLLSKPRPQKSPTSSLDPPTPPPPSWKTQAVARPPGRGWKTPLSRSHTPGGAEMNMFSRRAWGECQMELETYRALLEEQRCSWRPINGSMELDDMDEKMFRMSKKTQWPMGLIWAGYLSLDELDTYEMG